MARGRAQIQSSDVRTPSDVDIDIGLNDDIDPVEKTIQVVTNESMKDDRMKKIAAEEKWWRDFMNQKVEFEILETDDENAPNPVSCGVNGVHRHFYRGVRYTDKRMFIDSLIKVVRKVKTKVFKNNEGVDDTKMEVRNIIAYPIKIWHDPANKDGKKTGDRWFEHQQRNAF